MELNMFLKKSVFIFAIFSSLSIGSISHAQGSRGCEAYPNGRGMDFQNDANGNFRIMYTASVGITFDDVDAINDAKDEATLEAKAGIAKFLNDDIKSDEAINKAVSNSSSMSGQQKQAIRTETTTRLKNLSSSASALLRGVVVLGDCYTKGKEVRVTVGLKPETINAAGNVAGQMGGGASGSAPAQSQGAQPSSAQIQSQPLNSMNSSNNSGRVRNF